MTESIIVFLERMASYANCTTNPDWITIKSKLFEALENQKKVAKTKQLLTDASTTNAYQTLVTLAKLWGVWL